MTTGARREKERGTNVVALIRFKCKRSKRKFSRCRSCYRGHVYCGEECSGLARCRSLRAARRTYRKKEEVRRAHRDRERERRRGVRTAREAFVGDQGSPAEKPVADCASQLAGEDGEAQKTVCEPVERSATSPSEHVPRGVPCGRVGYQVAQFPRRPTGRRPVEPRRGCGRGTG